MNRGKTVFGRTSTMKTYGKGTVPAAAAWPPDVDNREHLFDSSTAANSSSNPSVCLEPTEMRKIKKTTVGSRVRTAKKEKENCKPSKEQPARRGNLVSRQERRVGRNLQLASETSSSNSAMSASCLEVESKQTRKKKKSSVGSRRVCATKRQAIEKGPSDSSIPKTKPPTGPSVALPRPAQLVTQRRGAACSIASMPHPNIDSSSEFVLGKGVSNAQMSLRRKARLIFSPETSVNDTVQSHRRSTIRRVCQQSSISEAEDQTFGPYHRKPLFCSTPSLQLVGKRPGVSSAAPPVLLDLSVPEELIPSGDVFSPPPSALLGEPGSGCKTLPIFTEAPDMHKTPSVILISDDSGSSYRSCETSGDRENPALKDMCLSNRCQVKLGRVDRPLPHTPYFSCLGTSSSALCSQTEEPQMVERVWSPKHSDRLCPGPPCHVTDYSASLIYGQSVYPSELVTGTFNLVLSEGSSQSVAQCDSSDNKSSVTDVQTSSLAHQQRVSKQVPEDKAAMTVARLSQESMTVARLSQECLMTVARLSQECLTRKSTVPLKRPASTRWTGAHGRGMHSERNARENRSTSSEDMTADAKECVQNPNECRPKKFSRAAKETKGRARSRDRPGTSRKAFVSGQSVSRWRDKGNASAAGFKNQQALRGGSKAGDSSITELLSGHHNEPKAAVNEGLLHGSGMVFSTPVRALPSHLDLSSLLASLTTPERATWSRLKARLSLHRRVTVRITPMKLPTSMLESSGRAGLVDGDVPSKSTPFSNRLQSRLQNSSAFLNTSECAELSDAEKVYAECNQQGALCWEECILPERLKRCEKIGEGTFGEVFSTVDASGDTVALKIIPIEGKEKVNGEEQKTFEDILHEMIISKELSSLKEKQHNQTYGFIGLHGLHCVKGGYPAVLLKAWDAFDRQKGSENDRPDFFEDEQLFLILEFEFGGSDLENSNGKLSSLVAAKSILHQVTAALAVAEQQLRFEHRDLHWGNILVKLTKEKSTSFLLNGTEHSLDTKGVLVRIIDYSLSRLEIDGLTVACDISEDEELFMGQGDYQYEIYRLMREQNGNKWDDYQPRSNVMWLHYLCSKLLSMRYRGPGGHRAKKIREELDHIQRDLLQYRSATEALQSGLF